RSCRAQPPPRSHPASSSPTSIEPSRSIATSLVLNQHSRSRTGSLLRIVLRDGAQIFIKSQGGITPLPNSKRHRHMRLDAFVYAPDPDALAADFVAHGAAFSVPLKDTNDGLRGFEVTDPDG